MTRPVVIIANPASGRDIRRLVAHASMVPHSEKVNIVRRVLRGLDAMGVAQVYIMPDLHRIGWCAKDGLDLALNLATLDMIPESTQDDSTRAAKISVELNAACIVVLGGDGTSRVVAKESGDIPLLPVATGTNNVFSSMVEGTLAGIAADVFGTNESSDHHLTTRAPRLEIWRGPEMVDIALVDIVVSSAGFVGARALYDVSSLKEVFLTRAEPENIGFSSLGGYLRHLPPNSGKGLHIRLGTGKHKVRTPIAPGLVEWVPVQSFRTFEPEESIPVDSTPAVIALDGEREFTVRDGEELTVKLNLNGPRVVNMTETLRSAGDRCLLSSD